MEKSMVGIKKNIAVTEYANEALKEGVCDICQCDDAMIVDWDGKPICTVEEFANIFWDKEVEGIL